MPTSRERVQLALDHEEPDRLPVDLGGSAVTGMHVSTVYRVRQALKLDPPSTPIKVVEPYQMLGEIKPDLMEVLGVDVVPLGGTRTLFGFRNDGWKPWTTFDGTPVLVPEAFITDPEPGGDILMYPEGDRSAPPSGRMPKGGFYFDTIVRQPPLDETHMNVQDNLEEFGPITDQELDHYQREAERLFDETDKAILLSVPGTGFGDIALVPGPWMKNPKGIRDIEEWYISLHTRPDHLKKIFERQCGIALGNLEKVYEAVGDRITAIFLTGTDFGTQSGPFMANETYLDLFAPFHRRLNDWVHANTRWKCFIHSCGSVFPLIGHFIEVGFDILNPVQISAANMDPRDLKGRFGDRLSFWGGGVDPQRTLPFGTLDEVREGVRRSIEAFGPGGGFVFNTVHNVQPKIPVENVLAMYEIVRDYGRYPL
jgi:hypothetical protein